ncbi:MAG: tRNA (adenosine(37)-N6)-threonylcarbamoyltransferase complex dimerization subunit type 1 TsaB [Capnocytophaga sp.]|nr:tRNA (adenosine(37)-N6)-threonylcarbamoyltransferase complex dimerization subunit type 1 TsaB [Capnocytophaga sp.]
MNYILCIESSGINCSVAVAKNGKLLGELSENTGNFTHAEKLHVFIEQLLSDLQLSHKELSAVAVSAGPGSYTGLRIGVASAKGICYALDIPLIAIPTLTIVSQQTENEIIIPMLDARRMEVYSAVYDHSHQLLEATKAVILDENSYAEWFKKNQKITFIGDGAAKFAKICPHPNAVFIPDAYPQARDMAALAYTSYLQNDFADIAYFEPDYLKPFHTGK